MRDIDYSFIHEMDSDAPIDEDELMRWDLPRVGAMPIFKQKKFKSKLQEKIIKAMRKKVQEHVLIQRYIYLKRIQMLEEKLNETDKK